MLFSHVSLADVSLARVFSAARRRFVDVGEELAWSSSELGKSAQRNNEAFKDIHLGKRCIILCNGPSLNCIDMRLVANEFSFCMNRSYLMFDKWGFIPSYFVAIAQQVIEQFRDDIYALPMPKFVDFKYRNMYPPKPGMNYLRLPPRLYDNFGKDLAGPLSPGGTVTYAALQIAYCMGFHKVIIVGMDHRFNYTGVSTTTQVRTEEVDKDHMHPNYFPKGMKWELPNLTRSEIAYRIARETFEESGREIIDATVDGASDIFKKMSLEEALADK